MRNHALAWIKCLNTITDLYCPCIVAGVPAIPDEKKEEVARKMEDIILPLIASDVRKGQGKRMDGETNIILMISS